MRLLLRVQDERNVTSRLWSQTSNRGAPGRSDFRLCTVSLVIYAIEFKRNAPFFDALVTYLRGRIRI